MKAHVIIVRLRRKINNDNENKNDNKNNNKIKKEIKEANEINNIDIKLEDPYEEKAIQEEIARLRYQNNSLLFRFEKSDMNKESLQSEYFKLENIINNNSKAMMIVHF